MELSLYWTDFAEQELRAIFNYYKKRTNQKIATKITDEILSETLRLIKQPTIGQIEPSLKKLLNIVI